MTTLATLSIPRLAPARLGLRVAALALTFVFVGMAVALCLVPWQQTAHGEGRVIAYSPTQRRHDVDAPIDGRIARWFVAEGSHVRAGEPIVEIVDNDPSVLDRLRSERRSLVARREAAKIAKATAALNLERQRDLHAQGLAARRSYELAAQEQARFAMDVAAADAEITRLDTRLARQDNQTVVAPHDGTILKRGEGQGSVLVKAGEPLATLVPAGVPQAVELLVTGNDLPLIRVGQAVRLQFEGWPAVQVSGWPAVAIGTFAGTVAFLDAADDGRGKFRVMVVPLPDSPWPDQLVVRQGIRAHGFLLAGRVRLGYELWRRFNGFPPVPQQSLGKST